MRLVALLLILSSGALWAEVMERRDYESPAPKPVKVAPAVRPVPKVPAPPVVRSKKPSIFKNGAGLTGNNWSTGVAAGRPDSTGVRKGHFDLEGAGQCGEGQNLWEAAAAVMSKKVIPQNKGYDLLAPGWPRIVGSGDQVQCLFGAGKLSMCTSATAAAICQHFADMSNSGALKLTPAQLQFLNGPQVKAAINGNSYSLAFLIQHLGGASIVGKGSKIYEILTQAKTGDLLRLDRKNETGHSTIFQKVVPSTNQVCYWSSNTLTDGTGVQCENISALATVVISRFPGDLETLPAKIDKMSGPWAMGNFSVRRANKMKESEVHWASKLDCP